VLLPEYRRLNGRRAVTSHGLVVLGHAFVGSAVRKGSLNCTTVSTEIGIQKALIIARLPATPFDSALKKV